MAARFEFDHDLEPPTPQVARAGRPPDPNRTRPVKAKRCSRHGVTEFAQYSRGRGRGYRWCCKRCVAEAVTRRHQKVRRILVEEACGCCAVCGYDACSLNFHFHHVDPTTKLFELSMSQGKSLFAFREEAKKCVLVCANCHGEIEAGLIESPPAGTKFGDPWPPRAAILRRRAVQRPRAA